MRFGRAAGLGSGLARRCPAARFRVCTPRGAASAVQCVGERSVDAVRVVALPAEQQDREDGERAVAQGAYFPGSLRTFS